MSSANNNTPNHSTNTNQSQAQPTVQRPTNVPPGHLIVNDGLLEARQVTPGQLPSQHAVPNHPGIGSPIVNTRQGGLGLVFPSVVQHATPQPPVPLGVMGELQTMFDSFGGETGILSVFQKTIEDRAAQIMTGVLAQTNKIIMLNTVKAQDKAVIRGVRAGLETVNNVKLCSFVNSFTGAPCNELCKDGCDECHKHVSYLKVKERRSKETSTGLPVGSSSSSRRRRNREQSDREDAPLTRPAKKARTNPVRDFAAERYARTGDPSEIIAEDEATRAAPQATTTNSSSSQPRLPIIPEGDDEEDELSDLSMAIEHDESQPQTDNQSTPAPAAAPGERVIPLTSARKSHPPSPVRTPLSPASQMTKDLENFEIDREPMDTMLHTWPENVQQMQTLSSRRDVVPEMSEEEGQRFLDIMKEIDAQKQGNDPPQAQQPPEKQRDVELDEAFGDELLKFTEERYAANLARRRIKQAKNIQTGP